jgi:membrane peptidoglycan carboxypeptidase
VDDVGKVGIALGIAPLTVEEQATTFATLADGGVYHAPHVIAKITKNGVNVPVKVKWHRVLTPAETADVNWALSFDTIYGTGYPNAVLNPARPTIGKTGTTDVAQSAFFIGALPGQYSLAFGMFTNSQNNVKGGQTLDILPSIGGAGGGYGGAWPATMWRLAMTRLLAGGHEPVAQLAPLNLTGFNKWVQVVKQKPKCNQPGQQGGGGNNGPGNGNGHGHHLGIFLPQDGKPKCTGPSPSTSPSPGPTYTPSPTPTPSGFSSPPPTPSPTPSPPTGPAKHAPIRRSAAGTPSLTLSALLPRAAFVKPACVPATTGLA